jgi:hypothetical protein
VWEIEELWYAQMNTWLTTASEMTVDSFLYKPTAEIRKKFVEMKGRETVKTGEAIGEEFWQSGMLVWEQKGGREHAWQLGEPTEKVKGVVGKLTKAGGKWNERIGIATLCWELLKVTPPERRSNYLASLLAETKGEAV